MQSYYRRLKTSKLGPGTEEPSLPGGRSRQTGWTEAEFVTGPTHTKNPGEKKDRQVSHWIDITFCDSKSTTSNGAE